MAVTRTITKSVILCVLCLFLFLGGITVGRRLQCSVLLKQEQFNRLNNIYLYDSQEKVEQWFRDMEDASRDWLGGLSEDEREEVLAEFRANIPLAVIGQLCIFHDHIKNCYSICERTNPTNIFVKSYWDNTGIRELYFHSKTSKGWVLPHTTCSFDYNEDGTYVCGTYITVFQDGSINRFYTDTKGNGQFDRMTILSEDGSPVVYEMKNMTWTKIEAEKPQNDNQTDVEN